MGVGMRRLLTSLASLTIFVISSATCAPAEAGWWIFGNDDDECQCQRCQAEEEEDECSIFSCCCLHIKKAPEAAIGLALPAELTDGQGLQITREDLQDALDSLGEDELGDEEMDTRLEELRQRVELLSIEVVKLTEIVREHADNIPE